MQRKPFRLQLVERLALAVFIAVTIRSRGSHEGPGGVVVRRARGHARLELDGPGPLAGERQGLEVEGEALLPQVRVRV